MSPISPSTRIAGLTPFSASTACRVCRTLSSNGSEEMSNTIESNPALAASIALASECVWSALRNIGTSISLRRLLWITATADLARAKIRPFPSLRDADNHGILHVARRVNNSFQDSEVADVEMPDSDPLRLCFTQDVAQFLAHGDPPEKPMVILRAFPDCIGPTSLRRGPAFGHLVPGKALYTPGYATKMVLSAIAPLRWVA